MAREIVVCKEMPPISGPYSYGVKAGGWVFTGGMLPVEPAGDIVGTAPGRADVSGQAQRCIANLAATLESVDSSLERVAKTKVYVSDFRHVAAVDAACRNAFPSPSVARSCVGATMPEEHAVVQLEATAVPNRATEQNEFFFSNGHLPEDADGELVGRGDIRAQVEQALDNLGSALAAAGLEFTDVIKMNGTVPSWYGFERYNEIYAKYFHEPFAARATIQGELPRDGRLIQFEAVAARGDKRYVESEVAGIGHFALKRRADTLYLSELPGAMAPHSHAVAVGEVVYLCGEIAYDPSGRLVGRSDIRAQTRKTMENLRLCVEALGGTLDDIVKTNVSITDARLIPGFIEEYATCFTPPYPAMTVAVAGLAQDCMVLEVEAVAVLGASRDAVAVVGRQAP